MRRLVAAGAAAVMLAACGPTPRTILAHGVPLAEPLAATYDFGEVEPGTVVRHRFEIANRGDQMLELGRLRSSCGCGIELAAADLVAPTELGAVDVTLPTGARTGPTVARMSVETNDPAHPVLDFVLHGRVKTDVRVDPGTVFFGRVSGAAGARKEVRVEILDPAVEIARLRRSSDRFEVRAERLEAPEHGMRLLVSLAPGAGRGRINDRIIVETTSSRQAVVEIPVLASIE